MVGYTAMTGLGGSQMEQEAPSTSNFSSGDFLLNMKVTSCSTKELS